MIFANRLTQESRIKVELLGGKVPPEDLREAVEFFLSGPGKDMPRPCNRGDWCALLLKTGVRNPPAYPFFLSDLVGEFLSR